MVSEPVVPTPPGSDGLHHAVRDCRDRYYGHIIPQPLSHSGEPPIQGKSDLQEEKLLASQRISPKYTVGLATIGFQ